MDGIGTIEKDRVMEKPVKLKESDFNLSNDFVIIIHGMGTHENGATKNEVKDALNVAAKGMGIENFDFSKSLNLVEFNYSEFFDQLRKKDGSHGDSLVTHIQFLRGHGLGAKLASKLINTLSGFDEDKAFYTHWMDVLYYGETYWGEKVRVDLAYLLIQILKIANKHARKVHVVAHSLGTAVLHDTLAELYDPDEPLRRDIPNLPTNLLALDSIYQLANVSRLVHLLSEVDDPNRSIVNSDGSAACHLLYSVRNAYDPFTWCKTYKRPTVNGGLLRLGTVRKINTHDLTEYVLAPAVARSMLGTICQELIYDDAYEAYVAEHAKSSITDKFDELKETFEQLKLTAFELEDATITDKVQALKVFFNVANEFKKLAESIKETE